MSYTCPKEFLLSNVSSDNFSAVEVLKSLINYIPVDDLDEFVRREYDYPVRTQLEMTDSHVNGLYAGQQNLRTYCLECGEDLEWVKIDDGEEGEVFMCNSCS